MKYYNNKDNYCKRTHTIQVTFQTGEYKGCIAWKVGGNCQGLRLLDFHIEDFGYDKIGLLVINDCNIKLHENDGNYFYTLELQNSEGATLQCEMSDNELSDLVVAIEIIDCEVEG